MKLAKAAVIAACGVMATVGVSTLSSCTDYSKAGKLESQDDSISYALGYNTGASYIENLANFPGGDSTINKEKLIAGFINAIMQDSTHAKMTQDDAIKTLQNYFQEVDMKKKAEEAANYQKSKKGNDAYIAKKIKEDGMKQLTNTQDSSQAGVLIKETVAGKGENIKKTDIVYLDYVGKLTDGTVFDETTGKQPALFPVSGVIPGFTQALEALKVGSQATIVIPSELGYGREAVGDGKIPANSILTFDVKILKKFSSEKEAKAFAETLRMKDEASAQKAASATPAK